MEIYKLFNVSENLITTVGEYVFKFLAERNITEVTIGKGNEHELHNRLFSRPRSNDKKKEPWDVFKRIDKIGINLREINLMRDFDHGIKIYDDEGEIHNLKDLSPDDIIRVAECIEDCERCENVDKEPKSTGKVIHFENEDIIITDPCYIINHDNDVGLNIPYKSHPYKWEDYDLITLNGWDKRNLNVQQSYAVYEKRKEFEDLVDKWKEENSFKGFSNDWTKCEWGKNMEILGLTKYLIRDTIYGDWSCTTFDSDTNEPLGEFCADAGEVGVFSLKEVLAYNPKFNYHIDKKWTTTLIKNFTGDIYDEVEKVVYKDDSGTERTDYEVHIIGKGSMNFITKQTGA